VIIVAEVGPLVETPQDTTLIVNILCAEVLILKQERLGGVPDIAQHVICIGLGRGHTLRATRSVKLIRQRQRDVLLIEAKAWERLVDD